MTSDANNSSGKISSANRSQSLFDRIGRREPLHRLLHLFYADVRQHNLIGPIFNTHIQDWPAHLEKLTDFWSGVTGGPARYRGGMPWKHIPLQLKESHFAAWLSLWHINCRRHLSEREAEEMIQAAEMIGQRLRHILAHASPLN